MATTETFQISPEQAELYEERFVPALFAHWVDALLEAADVRAGQDVLDVACGTGIVSRHAAERVGPTGHVTGLDLNPAMLAVASRVATGSRGSRATLRRCRSATTRSTSSRARPPRCSSPTSSVRCGRWDG